MDSQGISRGDMNTKISLRNHNSSPLLRLPAELRNKIYEYAMSNYKLEVNCWDTSIKVYVTKNFLSLTATCRQVLQETRLLPTLLNVVEGYSKDLLLFLAGNVLDNSRLEAITKISIIFKFPGFYDPPEYHNAVKAQLRDLLYKLGGMPNVDCVTIACKMTAEEFESRAGMRSGLLAHAQSVLGEQSGRRQIDVAVVCAV